MKKVELYMDEKRNLFLKDTDGTTYNFWPLGYGVRVSFMIETDAEQKARKEESEKIGKERIEQ